MPPDWSRLDLAKYAGRAELPGGDETAAAFADLLREEAVRERVEDAAACIAEFYTALTDRGIDSFGAACLTERFAVGAINPAKLSERWKR